MARSLWKPKLNFLNVIKTFSYSSLIRRFEILPEHVKLRVRIYNGKKKYKVILKKYMIGFKIGALFFSKGIKKLQSKKNLVKKKKK